MSELFVLLISRQSFSVCPWLSRNAADQAGLKLKVLGLKAGTTTPSLIFFNRHKKLLIFFMNNLVRVQVLAVV